MIDKKIFNQAFDRVIGHEGGFQKMHDDRGNWTSGKVGEGELKGTKFGISAMSFPDWDIENLTIEQAKTIYHSRYWLPLKMELFSAPLRYQLFDSAVNHGMRNTVKILQRAADADDDGFVGVKTLAAVNGKSDKDVVMLFLAERIEFYTQVNTFDKYGKGWMNRVAQNLKFAKEDLS